MSSRPLAAILTLGCKLNLADSESIASELRARGFAVVDRLCEADAYVVWERPRSPGAGLNERPHGHTHNYISVYGDDDVAAMELLNRITPVVLGGPLGDGLAARRNR